MTKNVTIRKACKYDPPPFGDWCGVVRQSARHKSKYITSPDRDAALDTFLRKNQLTSLPISQWN